MNKNSIIQAEIFFDAKNIPDSISYDIKKISIMLQDIFDIFLSGHLYLDDEGFRIIILPNSSKITDWYNWTEGIEAFARTIAHVAQTTEYSVVYETEQVSV